MKKLIPILLILLFATILRFQRLSDVPALNADEAAIGYNAYSLLETGLDEHGNKWPIHFQSFNDYKPGLYVYIVLPFVAVLGLTESAVRVPGAIFGVLNVLAIYLLVGRLYPKKKWLPEICALLLAISPWHLHFSRGGWEVNVATTCITIAMYFFVVGQKRKSMLIYSAIFFVAALYTYHAARIVIPLLGLLLLVFYRKNIVRDLRTYISVVLFTMVMLAPLGFDFLGPAGTSRASGVSIFSDRGTIDRINEQRGHYSKELSVVGLLLHNKLTGYTLAFAENYFEHFWGQFLFLSGDDIQRNKIPEIGQVYLIQLPLLVYGAFSLIKKKKQNALLVFGWVLITPLPAALTFQSPHALRAQGMVIPLTIITGLGLYSLSRTVQKVYGKVIVVCLLIFVGGVLAWDFARYLHQYWGQMAQTYPFSSQYGAKELSGYISSRYDDFDTVMITDRYDQPYIMMLFYLKYPPARFQSEHTLSNRDEFGFSTVRRFGKFEFTSIKWSEVVDKRGILVVGTDEEIPNVEANVIKQIYFPNGHPAYEIVPR